MCQKSQYRLLTHPHSYGVALLLRHLEGLAALRLYNVDASGKGGGVDGAFVGSHLAAVEVVNDAFRNIVGSLNHLDADRLVLEVETLDVGSGVAALELVGGQQEIVALELSLGLFAESERERFSALELYDDASFNVLGPGRECSGDGQEQSEDVLFHNGFVYC